MTNNKHLLHLYLAIFFFITSCNVDSHITSITISPVNEEIMQISEKNHIPTYYYSSKKNELLILNVKKNRTKSYLGILGKKDEKILFYYSKNNEAEKDISKFVNKDGEKIIDIQDETLKINISKIHELADYKIIARYKEVSDSYKFSIDTKKDISSDIKIMIVSEEGKDGNDEDVISTYLPRNTKLLENCVYLLKKSDNFDLKCVEFNNLNPNVLVMSNAKMCATTLLSDDGDIYINVLGKSGDKAVLNTRAGSKISENYYIEVQKADDIIIPISPPVIKVKAVSGGYRILFYGENNDIHNDYSLALKIDDEEIEILNERQTDENNFIHFFKDITSEGEHRIEAYYKKGAKRSSSNIKHITVFRDNLLKNTDKGDIISDTVLKQNINLENWEKDSAIRQIKIKIPSLKNKSQILPLSDMEYFNPYTEALAKIKVIKDDEQTFILDLKKNNNNYLIYNIYNYDDIEKIKIKVRLENVLGMTADDEQVYTIDINKQDIKCEIEYYMDSNNDNEALYRIKYNNKNNDKTMLYYSISKDGGKNFYYINNSALENGEGYVNIEKPLIKNSKETVLRIKTTLLSYQNQDFEIFSTANGKTATAAKVAIDDKVQLYPNIRCASITPPDYYNYDVFYLISEKDDEINLEDIQEKIKFTFSAKSIKVIEAKPLSPDKMTRYLYIKTQHKTNSNLLPCIKKYKVEIHAAPEAMQDKSDGVLWKNTGFFSKGICIYCTAPCDNSYIVTKTQMENTSKNGTIGPLSEGERKLVASDWDQCVSSYRYNRFYTVMFTRKKGYMDSKIDYYSGYERSMQNSKYLNYKQKCENAIEEIRNRWRCEYEI